MKIPLAGRRIWLTGASSGIGRACALEFARRGAKVALSARSVDVLEALVREIGPDQAMTVAFDATSSEANLEAVQRIIDTWGGIDTVLLNAGTCEFVEEEDFDASIFDRVFAVNFHAVTYGMEASLPILMKASTPHLAIVASCVCWLPLPSAEAYGASKAALRYLIDAFRYRAEARGLSVTGIYPGFVKSAMSERNDFPMPFLMSAEEAARRIADGLENRRREIHFPRRLTWPMKLLALAPLWLYQMIVPSVVKIPWTQGRRPQCDKN